MIGGPGIGLTLPSAGFPATIPGTGGVPFADNYIDLPAGGMFLIPPGRNLVFTGLYSWIQVFDPIMQAWVTTDTSGPGPKPVNSDGASWRVFNPLGTPVGALMTATGTTYTQAGVGITASAGGSTWRPIVGGAISQTITITGGGTNYTYRPTLIIDAPPVGGVPASAICTISAGAINAVTVINQGAGYKTVPNVTVLPHPLDPTIGSITPAVLTAALLGSPGNTGVAALLNTSPGTVLTSAPTLTLTGGDGNATAVAIMALTIASVAFSASGGVAYPGTFVAVPVLGGTVVNAASSILNPRISTGLFVPRAGNITAPVSGGVVGAAVIGDGGIYQVAPTGIVLAASSASAQLPTTATAPTFTMGTVSDRIAIIPVP